jgi:CubicO group peptidase (beta-lactamase class C family)
MTMAMPTDPQSGPPAELPDEVRMRLDRRLADEQRDQRLPSVVAGLVRRGALVWSGAAGTTTGAPDVVPGDDLQYRMGSITKTFVAVTVLRLRDEGLLALDDSIGEHLADAPAGDATVAQVLSHAAGIPAETAGPWWERTPGGSWSELASDLAGAVALRPGRGFHYSNVGYGVLGELVARIRGRSWFEVVTEELLRPLGMTRTTPRPAAPAASGYAVHPWAPLVLPEPEHDAGAMAPAGQLWSTIDDLARWSQFLHAGHDEVLRATTLEEMREPLVVDDRPGLAWTSAYGLGLQVWNIDGRRSFGHGGSMPGFLASLQVDVESGDGVVVATNTTAGLGGSLPTDLATILREDAPEPQPAWTPQSVRPTVVALTGTWYWGPFPLLVRAESDDDLDLAPLVGPGRASRFHQQDDGTYLGRDGYFRGETLRVLSDGEGRVTHLDLASFVLTRTPYDPDAPIPGGTDPAGWSSA